MSHEIIEQLVDALPFEDPATAKSSLSSISELGIPADLFALFTSQLQSELAKYPEPDRVLNCVERFLSASRSPIGWLGLFEREPEAQSTLIRLVSTSQYLADLLIRDPEAFDLVRVTDGAPVDALVLKDEILAEIAAATDGKSARRVLRDYRHREMMRIAYGDFINGQTMDTVVEQISILAECIVEAAITAAVAELERNGRRLPVQPDGTAVRFCSLALGKLGGRELNYSSDIDLIFIRENLEPAPNWEKPKFTDSDVDEYFQRLGQAIIKLLTDSTEDGIAYRVDMRLRPNGRNGSLVVSMRDAVGYYDSVGRTWERQAFVKARSIAGDIELGEQLLEELQPWIYRRYLMRADITGLVALKRRIEKRASNSSDEKLTSDTVVGCNVKLGYGGIRDIEYSIQFLQLLHGPDQKEVRCSSTLEAIRQLQTAGCITGVEQSILEENYRYLRRVEHHLQIMFDRQTHTLPQDDSEIDNIALRMEPGHDSPADAGAEFRKQLSECTAQNRQILDHLLHNAFAEYDYDEQQLSNLESDLILDPEPPSEVIESTLKPYGFNDCMSAYRCLQELAAESIPFLSTRRSRHFLAAIAPQLLTAISETPNPDRTLINLSTVSASLGGKAVLWELFSSHPPSLELCLRLCASSPYLASILTSNPGMIDELLDSLMLGHVPNHEELSQGLDELCRGAVEISPMLHNFKNSMHLRVGVRDILGKSTITETHAALADIAEVCMEQVIQHEFHRLVHKLGMPTIAVPQTGDEAAELVVLAVGKLGGREPNYHSDLDVIFLFNGEGSTKSLVPSRRFEPTTNRHFFNQLSQRVIHEVTRSSAFGRLYDMDVRLRPLGRSGQLAISIDDLARYFESGSGQVWERQALCKARPIWGSVSARETAMSRIASVLKQHTWRPEDAEQIYDHRMQLQKGAAEDNIKRGVGGTMDVEFVVQMLQLAHLANKPEILVPGTLTAISQLEESGLLTKKIATQLHENYCFLRSVESGLRLMNLSARHELPTSDEELEQLSFLLQSRDGTALDAFEFAERCASVRRECRHVFEETFVRYLPKQEEIAED